MQTLHMGLTNMHGWQASQWIFTTFAPTPEKWQRLPSRSEDGLKEGSLATIKQFKELPQITWPESQRIPKWRYSHLNELCLLKINALLFATPIWLCCFPLWLLCFHSLPLLTDTTSFGCSHGPPVLSGLTRLNGISNPTYAQWYSVPLWHS